jgi:hypothetical protein
MRKNTRAVVEAFQARKPLKACRSIWTDGQNIFSYDTCLVARSPHTGHLTINTTKYSPTTSRHQSGIALLLQPFTVGGMWRGVSADALVQSGLDSMCAPRA